VLDKIFESGGIGNWLWSDVPGFEPGEAGELSDGKAVFELSDKSGAFVFAELGPGATSLALVNCINPQDMINKLKITMGNISLKFLFAIEILSINNWH